MQHNEAVYRTEATPEHCPKDSVGEGRPPPGGAVDEKVRESPPLKHGSRQEFDRVRRDMPLLRAALHL